MLSFGCCCFFFICRLLLLNSNDVMAIGRVYGLGIDIRQKQRRVKTRTYLVDLVFSTHLFGDNTHKYIQAHNLSQCTIMLGTHQTDGLLILFDGSRAQSVGASLLDF